MQLPARSKGRPRRLWRRSALSIALTSGAATRPAILPLRISLPAVWSSFATDPSRRRPASYARAGAGGSLCCPCPRPESRDGKSASTGSADRRSVRRCASSANVGVTTGYGGARSTGAATASIAADDNGGQARMVGHSRAAVPGQRRHQLVRQPPYLPDKGVHHGAAVLAVHLDEHDEPRLALDQRGDVAVLGPWDQVALPMAGHGAVRSTSSNDNRLRHAFLQTATHVP